jgi:hypothetical protein
MDWVQFIVSVVIGLVSGTESFSFDSFVILHLLIYLYHITQVTLISSLEMPKADFLVVIAILSALAGYCAKIYFS